VGAGVGERVREPVEGEERVGDRLQNGGEEGGRGGELAMFW
jgi:hypothetical protein